MCLIPGEMRISISVWLEAQRVPAHSVNRNTVKKLHSAGMFVDRAALYSLSSEITDYLGRQFYDYMYMRSLSWGESGNTAVCRAYMGRGGTSSNRYIFTCIVYWTIILQ